MDRLNQLRGDANASRDSLDTSSLRSEAYLTANESSKYFSLSEVDSSFSSPKEAGSDDAAGSAESDTERIISNISPIPKKSELDGFKIGQQIEAANILSGGVNIFDDNENSYDEDELVIDDAAQDGDDKELKLNMSGEMPFDKGGDSILEDSEAGSPSKDTEVVLQIDGKNVDAIDIGNGLYLYRKDGEEELAAVQIQEDDQQQPNIKFLKVRENAEGNLEVYEEIEIEVPKEVPIKEGKTVKNTSHIPVKDITKISEPVCNKVAESLVQTLPKDTAAIEVQTDLNKDNAQAESKTEVNVNGKMMKFSESRKSPLIGTFTPMTFHSTPNKEGIPLTKTMVDLQLHPSRHSENVKKTIEVHTDNCKQKLLDTPIKNSKDVNELNKSSEDKELTSLGHDSLDKEITNDTEMNKPAFLVQDSNKDNTQIDKKLPEVSEEALDGSNKEELKTENESREKTNIIDEKPENNDSDCMKQNSNSPLKLSDSTREDEKVDSEEIFEATSKDVKIISSERSEPEAQIKVKEPMNKLDKEIDGNKEENKELLKETKQVLNSISKVVEKNTDIEMLKESEKLIQSEKTTKNAPEKMAGNDEKIELNDKNVISDNKLPLTSNEKLGNDTNFTESAKQHDDSNKPLQIIECSKEGTKILSDIKETKSENQHVDLNKPLEISNASEEDKKVVSDIQIQQGIPLDTPVKEIPTDLKSHNNVVTKESLQKVEKEMKMKTEVLEKPEEKLISEIIEKKNDTAAPKIENETKSQDVEIQISTGPKQSENKPSKTIDQSVKEIEQKSEMEIDILSQPKKTIDNSYEKIVKKIDVELKQSNDSIIPKSSTNALKPNTSEENNQKDLKVTEQNSSTTLLAAKKVNVPDVLEAQKKNESIKKIPEASVKSAPAVQILQKGERNDAKKDNVKINKSIIPIPKPINNNKAAVPFGKWTEANRQEFLNKIKEAKVPTNTSNTKQLKQLNDLNRRDVLQKIDSKRQSSIALAKVQESKTINKNKNESAAFTSKCNATFKDNNAKDGNVSPPLGEEVIPKATEDKTGNSIKLETHNEPKDEGPIMEKGDKQEPVIPADMSKLVQVKKDPIHRKEINNQDLIDKTIEGIINRAVTAKLNQDDPKQNLEPEKPKNAPSYTPVSLDEIESKMNELHGIPFVERPPHELPKVLDFENKSSVVPEVSTSSKANKVPKLLPFSNKTAQVEQKVSHPVARPIEESDDEIIEHEPITGDSECNKNNSLTHISSKDNIHKKEADTLVNLNSNSAKEPIITENDFEKFARRNSITYENCLTVSYDGKEQHNVIQTVVEKEVVPKKMSRNELMLAESKAKSNKHLAMRHNNVSSKIPTAKQSHEEDSHNKNYQSKVQIAYHSAMTAKRHQESPISIIEDKPVKVVYMDSSHDFVPQQLILQGKELSPAKKNTVERDVTHNNSETIDADVVDADVQRADNKLQDETKLKSKHQRKQVLAPVEVPELELIEPRDLGIEASPKKKRKIEDNKPDKNCKALVPKKSYLLNRNITSDATQSIPQSVPKPTLPEPTVNQPDVFVKHSDPISAIDNLVKAAELLETQSENKEVLPPSNENSQSPQNTPFKRGRGRPRKYPLPDTASTDSKSPSPVKTPIPQKKPRLIDAKIKKVDTESDDDDTSSVDSMGLVKENWTMGKINENIVCPICNKLFRSENVVFKHVKHCTGPSPNRSDSDKRSPRRMRPSQDVDSKSEESKSDNDEEYNINKPNRKRKSNDKDASIDEKKTDVIVIEDTPVKPIKETLEKREKSKHEQSRLAAKSKMQQKSSSLVCEFCGKTFRQLSYLVNHKLQHKNSESKKIEKEQVHKSLFSCETCKKEFRKLHHLVQHRIIHNPNPMSSRSSRKSSSEQSDGKPKDGTKPCEDHSAGFRCEPCDKSFRKLHHLVEHRETHDEINKKGSTAVVSTVDTTKANLLHNCDVCKKSFKKLQHLIEHKDHHLETSSEKSDDKSVKSSLSTKDIIHECPLCYMVFPNEHSLNKHNIICQRKKKQSAAKSMKKLDETNEDDTADSQDEEVKILEADQEKALIDEKTDSDSCIILEDESQPLQNKEEFVKTDTEEPLQVVHKDEPEVKKEIKSEETEDLRTPIPNPERDNKKVERKADRVPLKSKKHITSASAPVEIIKIPDTPTPKKKLPGKEKTGATVAKRQKSSSAPLPVTEDVKATNSSDDDEVRYMLNPDFVDESNEGKLFMKVQAKKRNSLQIERPNSKDLVKRRISLQHPPKIPRLKAKPIPRKSSTSTVTKSTKPTPSQLDPVPSSDSDDSDVKYSFPVSVKKEVTPKQSEKKLKSKMIVEKRKSLSTIAKRKSMGKAKHKVKSPVKLIRKRKTEAEHRCDCGQLFSSAAMLSRHTSLAHTPPRVRRRRSSPPPQPPQPEHKPPPKPARKPDKPQDAKKTPRTEPARGPKPGVATRKSSVTKPHEKAWRTGPHRGVPVPDKMRKLMDKSKK